MSEPNRGRQFRPLPVPNVKVSGFWGDRQEAVCDHTAETLLDRCVEAGMLDQIDVRKPSPGIVIPRHSGLVSTQMFWDSDLGKSIETIAYSLYRKPNPKLEARVDEIVDMYERLQAPDGYLNSWFQRIEPGRRWTNLRDTHELYCAGHLMEAAVAYYQATGKRKLFDIVCRYADHMITVFGHGPGQLPGYCGHEEIELALVKLARVTGERKYLDLAKFFIDERGREPHFFTEEALRDGRDPKDFVFGTYEYGQAHMPVREQRKVVGHAVRAMYLYSGMADIATEYKDDTLTTALEALWSDLADKQMYVTGGIGPAASNEGFTDYYDLPNESAYAETCASVGLVFWASRMLGRGPDRRYADIMEQALYNGALSGLSLDGQTFFYENPLESAGRHHRWTWHHCPCCPPNIARLVASLGAYMYGVADDEIAVHLYCESVAEATLGGARVKLTQKTNYPWQGAVGIGLSLDRPARFALSLRIPGWAKGATLAVNGRAVDLSQLISHGYARIEREWRDGDRLELHLPLAARAVWADPRVRQDAGRVAVMRGPLVYCAEAVDNGPGLNSIILDGQEEAREKAMPDIPGAVAIELPALRETAEGWGEGLYRETPPERQKDRAVLVPYHLWDNRAPGEMLVWMRNG
ncbi:beta-L-arabinofuranosidase domain-containing protein [Chelativorans sp. AA-79]|uniref:glycoside hydrolase family 127 protein n=1 Tax=Chelativorans sp. AA-79 TaxID=3028735 RepID=UPI0023F7EBFE|nr:beta-L-arabinofuranosidase domain-containing protein [Chelativorans sp. AA-79]WEX08189.1 glycoside hydrolase family 127 protein [Chelativorans sp. AA-79]